MKQSRNITSNSGIEPLTKKMSHLISVNDSMEEGSGESCSDTNQIEKADASAYDVTELQARAILMLASHQTEQRMRKEVVTQPLPVSFQQRLCSPVNGVSMKRSLRRFLQKRKLKAQARAPY